MTAAEFKQLFLPLGKRFYITAYRMLGNSQDAEDTVQDVFVKLWGMKNSLRGIRNPEAFGVTMTRNICIDRLRSAERRHTGHVRATSGDIPAEDNASSLDGKIKMRRIRELLASLPERQRKVFELRYFNDCELKEIEKITGLGAVNVRVLISRTKKIITEQLEKEFAI
ncbi:MAG: RNA polymerase sigma factor [Bacteroidales bacterium]|jgi:RNA polymerase sigma-70 factor (ECF subfamily)|nr:RNA polymerase sigma factor [Bacteroidales bacterium]MCI2121370.1 RNA polymerase sigma factor [Bacteroidales bacterium]MCI2145511.1 RNA polymerase sigma factor [Bacteroidales bacterium]